MKKIIYFISMLLFLFFTPPLVAECKPISDYGAVGDGITDDTEAFQKALNDSGILNLETGKTYVLNKGLLIPSKTIINGNNSSLLIQDVSFFMNETNLSENNGKGLFYYQFFFPKNYSSMSELLEINNLDIDWNVSRLFTHVNTYYLFIINNINTATFNNVNITIAGNPTNAIHPIKFNSCAKNVTFDHCSIYNYTHGNDGSCIWFHANNPIGYPAVSISNCLFYSEAHDELISAWGPYKKNITVSNCIFHRHCVPCLSPDKKTITPTYICLVSKSTPVLSGTYSFNQDNSSTIIYEDCIFNITSDSENSKPYYFVTASSHYGASIKTYFNNCTIIGSFSKAFISGESNSSNTNLDLNIDYHNNIGIFFSNCNLVLNTPTLITTRSTNSTFYKCTINTSNVLMDTFYVDTNILACSYHRFTNNTIIIPINPLNILFKDLNETQSNQLYVHNNQFYCPASTNVELFSLSCRDYSCFDKLHSLGAESVFSFEENKIITK